MNEKTTENMNEEDLTKLQAQINAELAALDGKKILPSINPEPTAEISKFSAPRPWLRFWATIFDTLLLVIIFLPIELFLTKLIGGVFDLGQVIFLKVTGENFLNIASSLIQFFVIIFCLRSFQSTPGKALLNIKIKMTSGRKISFVDALKRYFWLYIYNASPLIIFIVATIFAEKIPVLSIILTLIFILLSFILPIVYYFKLKREGITPWDRRAGFTIEHHPISDKRLALIISLFMVLIAIIISAGIWAALDELRQTGFKL